MLMRLVVMGRAPRFPEGTKTPAAPFHDFLALPGHASSGTSAKDAKAGCAPPASADGLDVARREFQRKQMQSLANLIM